MAAYLSRCLFSLLAEDVELLPKGAFHALLAQHRQDPATVQQMLRILWGDMDRGGFSAALNQGVVLTFAIADHPWVDSANGAAVAVGATVCPPCSTRWSRSGACGSRPMGAGRRTGAEDMLRWPPSTS